METTFTVINAMRKDEFCIISNVLKVRFRVRVRVHQGFQYSTQELIDGPDWLK